MIKSLDRGIHYWNVGSVSCVGRLTLVVFVVYESGSFTDWVQEV